MTQPSAFSVMRNRAAVAEDLRRLLPRMEEDFRAARTATSSEDGAQTATLRRAEGAQAAGMGDEGQVIVEGVPVSTGTEHGWRRP